MQEQSRIEQEQHALLHEAITLNQNRVLVRLRSRHAILQCNFKKEKMQQPKVIPQLYEAINGQALVQTSGVAPLLLTALKADVQKLHGLFARLENLATPKAKSSQGLEVLIQIVITCQRIHHQRILHEVLTRTSRLEPGSGTSIARTITKLGRYSAVSRFLLQAARKYSVFSRVRISAVCLRAPNLPATELDSMSADLIHRLLNGPKLRKLASKFHGSSLSAIKDYIRQEATLAIPVHAEVQLLCHYEWNSCPLPPRIMCSSKQACFLCNLFFKIHGRFIVPSTHGRLYEKWALPDAVKSIANADGDMLTTLRSFASAVENALLREIQSSRRSYPDPYESIILHSAVCSQSNRSTTSARSSSASQRPVSGEDPIAASKNDNISRKSSPMPHAGKAAIAIATASATERRIDALRSRSEASSAATIRAPSPSNAFPEYVISSEKITNSTSLYVSLTRGQPIWREISPKSHSFEVRTPRIHLIISQDELFGNLRSQGDSHDLVASSGRYWAILEYLSDSSVPQGENVPFVNVLDVPSEREMTLDYGSAEWPLELRLYSNGDVISIMYSSHKPAKGLEYRM